MHTAIPPLQNFKASHIGRRVGVLLLGALLGVCTPAHAQKSTVSAIHTFAGTFGGGVAPDGALVEGPDGMLYGTTVDGGGPYDSGTAFRVAKDGSQFQTLVSFGLLNGANPVGDLALGSDGNFYGVTTHGGDFDGGVIFRMTPSGALTVLYSFDPAGWGGNPLSGLMLASDGNFYGTTQQGTVTFRAIFYRLAQSGEFSIVSQLPPATGYGRSRLVQGTDADFYGTTINAIFRAELNGRSTIVHQFRGVSDVKGLTLGSDGNLYGTDAGANVSIPGAVFRFTPPNAVKIIHSFERQPYGSVSPVSGVVEGSDGYLHGALLLCTSTGCIQDEIYRVALDVDGPYFKQKVATGVGYAIGNQIQASDGAYYAVSSGGGHAGKGTVMQIVQP